MTDKELAANLLKILGDLAMPTQDKLCKVQMILEEIVEEDDGS